MHRWLLIIFLLASWQELTASSAAPPLCKGTLLPIPTKENTIFPRGFPPTSHVIILSTMCKLYSLIPSALELTNSGHYQVPHAAMRAAEQENPTDTLYEHALVGNPLACAVLICRDADVAMQCKRHLDNTPLHAACRGSSDNRATVQLLLLHGARVNSRNTKEKTPLHYCCKHGHLEAAKLLIAHGAYLGAQDRHRKETPLHTACRYGHATVVAELLEHSPDVKALDRTGNTPLQLATVYRHQAIIDLLGAYGVVE